MILKSLISLAFLVSLLSPAVPHVYAETAGPYIQWWAAAFDGSDRYPGGTIVFEVFIVNSRPVDLPNSIDVISLVTPWKTYVDPNLPVSIGQGEGYRSTFEIEIPTDQTAGNVDMTFTFSSRYWDGFGWSSFPDVFFPLNVKILPNPFVLQNQIISNEEEISSLQLSLTDSRESIASLENQLVTAEVAAQSLTIQLDDSSERVASLEGRVGTLEEELTTVKTSRDSLQTDLAIVKSDLRDLRTGLENTRAELASVSSELVSTESDLASTGSALEATRSQLATFQTLYLPLGIGIPALAAIALAIRRRRR